MPQEIIKTIKIKDSTNIPKTYIERTSVIETTSRYNIEYFSKSLNFISSIAWPLVFCILLISFRRNIVQLFIALIDKIKVSDNINLSTRGISLSSSKLTLDQSISTQNKILPTINDFDSMSKKVLSTLWLEQLGFDNSYINRWTFTLGTNHPNFPQFAKSIQTLRIFGLVTFDLTNGQLFLTNYGIEFCIKYKDQLGDFSFFKN